MNKDFDKLASNRAYQFVEEQQQALDEGRVTEEQWFDIYNCFFTAAYLAADNPRAQSGHDGDEARYRYSRMMILEAIDQDGTFLDVGCANGYLIESLDRWLSGFGPSVTFYGLDISEELLALARQRLPQWHERFFVGNALYWTPRERYNYVYLCGLELVPLQRQQELLGHLYRDYVTHGGRLILGPITEVRAQHEFERQLRVWDFKPTGYCEKSHQDHEGLVRRMFWFDKKL